MRNATLPILLVLASATLAAPGDQRTTDMSPIVVTGMVPKGELGIPLGQLVLLEGVRVDGMKYGVGTMSVDKIDGKKVASPTSVSISNVELPKGKHCALQCYETMEMEGEPPAYEQLARLNHEPPPNQPQLGWQVHCWFIAIGAVEPRSLKIGPPDDHR